MSSERYVRPGYPRVLPEADDRTAWRFLWWLVRLRPWPLVASVVLGVLWMVPLALVPAAVPCSGTSLSLLHQVATESWFRLLLGNL